MKRYFSIVSLLALILLCASCGKQSPQDLLPLQQFFETNILNRDYKVTLAQDVSGDITDEYDGYVFRLLKTDFYHGPLKVTKGSTVYNGTWSCDNDYGKLTIALPDSPEIFQFLTRDWKFLKKDIPTLQLAPWGTTESIQLNMTQK
jgi:hypothetical protein